MISQLMVFSLLFKRSFSLSLWMLSCYAPLTPARSSCCLPSSSRRQSALSLLYVLLFAVQNRTFYQPKKVAFREAANLCRT